MLGGAFSSAAKRAIEPDLPAPVAVAVVHCLYGAFAAGPYPVGKPLRFKLEGSWSARRGQYRVTYSIHDEQVLVGVVRISLRGDSIASSGTKSGAQGVRLPLTDAGVTILSAGRESGLPDPVGW